MNKSFAQVKISNKLLIISAIIILCAGVFVSGRIYAAMTSGDGFQIWADTISTGGLDDGLSVSSGYIMDDTVGEVSGDASSTNFSLKSGYRQLEKTIPVLTLDLDSTSLDLGTLSTTSEKTVNHNLTLVTNYSNGASVSFSGGTLSSSGHQITAIGTTPTSSQAGVSQFGLVAQYVSGDEAGQVAWRYNNTSTPLYAFNESGDQIITSNVQLVNGSVFNIKYLANINGTEPAGSYSTNITYTATANF